MSVEAAADKDFKILQLSDIQIIDPDQQPAMPNVEVKNMYRDLDACAFDQVRWLVEKTQPDFIVLTGDNVYGEFDHDGSNFSALVALMESFKTPWTLVFGNHDGETYPGKGMAWQSNYLLENTEYCVFSVGNDYYETEGYGNFVVDIEDGNGIRCSLIMMDSHGCRREMNAGIYPNQIKWYEACVKEAAEIKHGEFNPDAGKVVPSYVFFHIPIEQFDKAMNEKYGGVNGIGSVSENDNGDFGKNRSSASFVDKNGFFAKAKSLESTKGIFAAHSHLNNSSVLYQGIRLTYGTKTGIYDEHDTEMLGGKLLTVNGSGETTVKEVLYDGELPNEDDYADSETPGGSSGGGEAPVDPTPTPGPENTNLGIVVKDIAHSPTEADWAEATAYDMLPNTGNITGATGKVKILTSGGNIYYRMDVTDPSTDANADGIYIYLGNGEKTYEARGNYENWLAAIHNDFGSQTELFMRTTAKKPREYLSGVYSFVQGFDLGGLIKEGASIRLVLKHRDSRSVWEPWRDGDYTHTIYFDQQITFGKQAEGGSDLPENNGVVVKNLTH
ncbi:MAG: metallophosphoesterase, partial [Clostridia bacterium]|nr:metallophosphoesterase [Clostridia bacterium]